MWETREVNRSRTADVLLVLATVVARWVVHARDETPWAVRGVEETTGWAVGVRTTDLGGALPDDLGEVAGVHGESRVVPVVLGLLVDPALNCVAKAILASAGRQVLAVRDGAAAKRATRVLEDTLVDPLLGQAGKLVVPSNRVGVVACASGVVRVKVSRDVRVGRGRCRLRLRLGLGLRFGLRLRLGLWLGLGFRLRFWLGFWLGLRFRLGLRLGLGSRGGHRRLRRRGSLSRRLSGRVSGLRATMLAGAAKGISRSWCRIRSRLGAVVMTVMSVVMTAVFALLVAPVAGLDGTLVVTVLPHSTIEGLLLLRRGVVHRTLEVAVLPDIDTVRLAGVERTCLVVVAAGVGQRDGSGRESYSEKECSR